MAQERGLYRSCPLCGHDYKASRPACPACGKPPFTRRQSYVVTGPRMLLIVGLLFFVSLAIFGFALSSDAYERHRDVFFRVPQTASRIAGVAGTLLFSGLLGAVFLRRKP